LRMNNWPDFKTIDEIEEMWINEELTMKELVAYTTVNCNLFIKLILNFPYELSDNQKFILDRFFDPKYNYRELLLVCGRKSGKTDLGSAITLFQVYRLLNLGVVPQKFFGIPSGKPIWAVNIGTSQKEALGATFNTIKAMAMQSWYLRKYIKNTTKDEIQFPYNIVLSCQTSSARAGRGFAKILVLYDEIAHFLNVKTGNLSGDEVYNANQPDLDPCYPLSLSVLISSPAGKRGIFWELFRTGDPVRVIQRTPEHGTQKWRAVFQYATWELNPKLPLESKLMQQELKRDPDKFEMERGAKFCDTLDAALPREPIFLCAGGHTYQEGYRPIGETVIDKETPRVIALDPALTGDSYGLMMGHWEDNIIVFDLVQYWQAYSRDRPVNIEIVEDRIRDLCKRFNVRYIVLDQFQSASTIQRLRKEGLPIYKVPPKGLGAQKFNQIGYEFLLDRIRTLKVKYPWHKRLLNELCFLQRKQTGKNVRYEAAVGYTDDLTDCAARICFVLEKIMRRPTPHVGWK